MVAPVIEMKWMILGGGGQLGRALSSQLKKDNIKFITLNRAQLDITSRSDVQKWFAREVPNVVVNAAAWTNVDLAESEEESALLVNALGPKLLAEESARIGAKFVQLSTDYVFSGESTTPWDESAELSPVSAYGRTKAQGERFVLDSYKSGSFIVRTAWLYSPWGKNFVKTVAMVAGSQTRNIEVVNDQIGQPTSAMDLAQQILRLINSDASPGIFHGTNSGQVTWFELARFVFELLGEDQGRVIPVHSSHFPRPARRPNYSVLGHDGWNAKDLLPMRNWQVALEDTLPLILQVTRQGE